MCHRCRGSWVSPDACDFEQVCEPLIGQLTSQTRCKATASLIISAFAIVWHFSSCEWCSWISGLAYQRAVGRFSKVQFRDYLFG